MLVRLFLPGKCCPTALCKDLVVLFQFIFLYICVCLSVCLPVCVCMIYVSECNLMCVCMMCVVFLCVHGILMCVDKYVYVMYIYRYKCVYMCVYV